MSDYKCQVCGEDIQAPAIMLSETPYGQAQQVSRISDPCPHCGAKDPHIKVACIKRRDGQVLWMMRGEYETLKKDGHLGEPEKHLAFSGGCTEKHRAYRRKIERIQHALCEAAEKFPDPQAPEGGSE